MLTDSALQHAISRLPGEKVTEAYMRSRIKDTIYRQVVGTLTICVIILDNGYTVTGESACVDPQNYRQEIGERLAYQKAFEKLWPLFGFLLAEQRFRAPAAA